MRPDIFAAPPDTPFTNQYGLTGLGLIVFFILVGLVIYGLVKLIQPMLDRAQYNQEKEELRLARDQYIRYRQMLEDLDD